MENKSLISTPRKLISTAGKLIFQVREYTGLPLEVAGGVVTTRGIRGMEERRGLETGAATRSWTVELGVDRLGPTLGRTESTMSPHNAGLLAA